MMRQIFKKSMKYFEFFLSGCLGNSHNITTEKSTGANPGKDDSKVVRYCGSTAVKIFFRLRLQFFFPP
jgi:hypothetical protein